MPYPNKDPRNMTQYPFVGQVRVNGQKRKKLCQTKKEAVLWEIETRAEMENPQEPLVTILTVSLLEWQTRYLNYCKRKFVTKTYQEKRTAFKQLAKNEEVYQEMSVEDLDVGFLVDHLLDQEEERSGNAANKDRKNLQAAWKWAIINIKNFPLFNPFTVIPRVAETRHRRHMPTLDDFMAVLNHTETTQDRLMLLVYLYTGARREELFRMQWSDVDFKKKRVQLHWRKNKLGEWKAEWLPLKDDLIPLLKEQEKKTRFKKYVFMNFKGSDDPKFWEPYRKRQHWLKNLCEDAKVEKFGFHGIRHLFASILASQNVPLVDIQFMLRHEHLTTTEKYIRRLKKENRKVLDALPDFDFFRQKPPEKPPKEKST